MPTTEQMRNFLREHYLHSRFEGRDGGAWGGDYSACITQSAIDALGDHGVGFIGPYEAASGRAIKYDANLQILNPDEPRAQLGKRAPNLTHIYGQSMG